LSTFDWRAAVIALCSGAALLGFKTNLFLVLGVAAVAGVLLGFVG
jgi:hypothetical protein